jgi:deazaflavin-dependent oxidoreductase (nitroreductase family)
VHRWILRTVHERVLATSGRMPVLLLTTTGRKTGQPRTWQLWYLEEGDAFVIVASNSGKAHPPYWYLDLVAGPCVVVEGGGVARPMRAEVASPAERARLWPLLVRADPLYAEYARRTTREIPVVLLRPA